MYVQANEAARCFEEGVLRSAADANIGSIFGIGFPAWTGGVLQYINGYEGRPGTPAADLPVIEGDGVAEARGRTVAVDLRDDWVTALRSAGFDPSAPTAWIAEGLFGYLPPEAQDRLLAVITEHSAPGSRLAAEAVPGISEEQQEQARERMQAVRDQWSDHGFDLDFSELVYLGERTDADTHLVELGWQTSALTTNALLERYGLPVPDEQEQFGHPSYITAIKQ